MISLVLTLCTALACDDYVIAQDSDADIINHTLYVESEELGDAWHGSTSPLPRLW